MAFLIDGVTPIPENGDTGWGTTLNAAINSIDGRFTWTSGQAVAKKAAANGLTGATLPATVTASSLTSVGTLSSLNVTGNVVVTGNFTVNGTTTTINTTTLTVSDNIIILNNDVTGTPTENAGIEVERGTSPNVAIRWNEVSDIWELTNDGSTYTAIAAVGGAAAAGTLTGTTLAANVVSSSLTALGTVTTGLWNAQTITSQYGGTGVNNGGRTITIGGNLTTSGAFALTFTTSNTTNVILPTTGTLATLAGSESLTNKKLGSLTTNGFVTTSGGDGTLGVAVLGAGVSTFLTTPSSANLASAVTDETGSGSLVFGTSPSFTTSITTGSATFSLVNTTATAVNFAGAATALTIGATTGTTTVRNALTVTGATILGPAVLTQQSSSYTLVLGDAGEVLEMTNSTDAVVTVPTSTVAYPIGTQIVIVRNGTGKVQIVGSPGVTVSSDSSKQYISTQYSAATLIKRGTDSWYLIGNLAAS